MRLRYSKYTLAKGVEKVKTKTGIAIMALSLALGGGGGLASLVLTTAHAAPVPQVVYSALPSVSPDTNYPSQPFQAQQTNEFGDYVHLAGSARLLSTVTLTMSDWAKQSTAANQAWCTNNAGSCDSNGFTWPVTVNFYANTLDANDVPTTLLGSKTVNVHVPWRPESDPSCGATSNGTGWMENGICFDYSGIAFNAHFDLSSMDLTLPSDVIVGFAYNTQSYGPNPTHIDGPYNSLNIAVPENNSVTKGTDDSATEVFWNTDTKSYYSNQNCTGGTFCKDTDWTYQGANVGTVAMQITALPGTPATADDCKNGGWMNVVDANGNSFKNQGQCVSWVQHNVLGHGTPAANKPGH